nr:OprO/OprP family phosphate-selective porin [Myxococcota bacterium]
PEETPPVDTSDVPPPHHDASTDVEAAPATVSEAEAASTEGVLVAFEPGDGLVVESRDGQFALATRVRVQFLASLTVPEDGLGPPNGTGDLYADAGDADLLLGIRRARVVFAGHLFGRENRFKLELAISPSDLGFAPGEGPTRTPLLDWYVDLRHHRDVSVRVGQYKLPFSRERVISSGDLALVDRSLTNAELTIDRDVGFDLRSADFLGLGWLRYYAGISAGEGRDAGFGNDVGLWYFARVELLPLGMFDDYQEADLARHASPRLSIGAAYAFLDDAPRLRGALGPVAADGGTTDYHQVAADVMFKWMGFSLFSEMIVRDGARNPGDALDEMGNPIATTAPRTGVGWFAQAGYLLPMIDLQVVARVGMLHPLGDAASTTMPERGELGGGLSYYFAGHSYKLQLDYFHLWSGGDVGDSEDVVRLQLQAAL